jgi:protein-S-isoprenylcysteine O-methyltransferase Ste14
MDEFMRWALGIQFVGVYGIARSVSSGFMQLGEMKGWEWKESYAVTIGMSVIAFPWLYQVFVYFVSPGSPSWMYIGLPNAVRWTGLAASIPVSGFLIWVFKTVGTAGAKQLVTFDDMKLATTGPYSRIRHPMYTGMFLHGITWSLFTDHWGTGGGFVALVLFLVIFRVPREEEVLLEHFGEEYRQYMARTGRFLPQRKALQ